MWGHIAQQRDSGLGWRGGGGREQQETASTGGEHPRHKGGGAGHPRCPGQGTRAPRGAHGVGRRKKQRQKPVCLGQGPAANTSRMPSAFGEGSDKRVMSARAEREQILGRATSREGTGAAPVPAAAEPPQPPRPLHPLPRHQETVPWVASCHGVPREQPPCPRVAGGGGEWWKVAAAQPTLLVPSAWVGDARNALGEVFWGEQCPSPEFLVRGWEWDSK